MAGDAEDDGWRALLVDADEEESSDGWGSLLEAADGEDSGASDAGVGDGAVVPTGETTPPPEDDGWDDLLAAAAEAADSPEEGVEVATENLQLATAFAEEQPLALSAQLVQAPALLQEIRAALESPQCADTSAFLGRFGFLLGALDKSVVSNGRQVFEPSIQQVVDLMASTPHVRSAASMSTDTGLHASIVQECRIRLGAACMHIERHVAIRMVDRVSQAVLEAGGELVSFTTRVRYDETPLVVRGRSLDNIAEALPPGCEAPEALIAATAPQQEAAPTKLVQMEWLGGMLVEVNGAFSLITFDLPISVSAVDRTTADVYAELQRRAPDLRYLEGRFSRSQRLSTTDADGACCKAERAVAAENRSSGHCHLTCDIHKTSHIAQRVGKLVSFDITGVISIALALQAPGSMRGFRRVLRRQLAAKVVRLSGSPGALADQHRVAVLDMYCPVHQGRPRQAMQRFMVEALANGDYSNELEVHHYCRGCCANEAETKVRFVTVFTNMLCRQSPKVFPRARWTGVDECLQALGLMASMHGLLRSVFAEWASSLGTKIPAVLRQAGGASMPALALEDEPAPGDDDDEVAAIGIQEVVANARDLMSIAQVSSSDEFRRLVNGVRQRALVFVEMPSCRARLVIVSQVLIAQQQLMRDGLHISGSEWATKEEQLAAFAELHSFDRPPKWRTLMRGSLEVENKFMERLGNLLDNEGQWRALQLRDHNETNCSLAFRLVGLAGASCHQSLRSAHQAFPWRAFALAAGAAEGDFAEELQHTRRCLLDPWTRAFVDKYDGCLDSAKARADCLSTAFLIHCDTAEVERKHASIRRRVTVASTQTTTQKLEASSSEFVFRQVAGLRRPDDSSVSCSTKARKRAASTDEQAPPSKRTRGGGPYRAFLHQVTSGQKGRVDWKARAAEYNALPEDRKAHLKALGHQATRLHRQGHRSFGPSTRMAERARAKRFREEALARARQEVRTSLVALCTAPAGPGCLDEEEAATLPGNTLAIPARVVSWEELVLSAQRSIQRMGDRKRACAIELASAKQAISDRIANQAQPGDVLATLPQQDSLAGLVPEVSGRRDLRLWRWKAPDTRDRAAQAISLRKMLPAGKAFMKALDDDWRQRHEVVCNDSVRQLGPVPAIRTRCSSEGICLCSKEGRATRLMMEQLNRVVKEVMNTTEKKALLTQGFVGCLLDGAAGATSVGAAAGGGGSTCCPPDATNVGRVFLHASMHSLSPFRPTYLVMDVLSVDADKATCSAKCVWQTQAEAIANLDKTMQWTLRLFRLRESKQLVPKFLPKRQVYVELPMGSTPGTVWRGHIDQRKADAKAIAKWSGEREGNPAEPADDDRAGDEDALSSGGEGASDQEQADLEMGNADDIFYCSDDDLLVGVEPGHAGAAASSTDAAPVAQPPPIQPPPAPEQPAARQGGDSAKRSHVDRSSVMAYAVPGGEIRYYPATRRFVAHCENPLHGVCRREKLAFAGARPAQGRPLGYLQAWLLDADYGSHDEHLACTALLDLPTREAGRQALKEAIGEAADLFAMERPRKEGEPEEPAECP